MASSIRSTLFLTQVFEEYERRFCLMDCSDEFVHNKAYWKEVWAEVPQQTAALANFLGLVDLIDFDPSNLPYVQESVDMRRRVIHGTDKGFVLEQLTLRKGIFRGKVDRHIYLYK